MSFILDALRKSEHERQRQAGPALVEAAVAPSKPAANRWATAAIALLVVNLLAIGVLLLMKAREEPAAAVDAKETGPAVGAAAARAATAGARVAAPPAPTAQASVTQALPEPVITPPPRAQDATGSLPMAGTRNSLAQEVSTYAPPMDDDAALAAATPPPGPAAVTPMRGGSVIYEPLTEADPAASNPPPVATGSLPRADDMAARGAVPELRLELHVWSTKPAERFVFVNGRRYREGDATAEGPAVVEITREGVIMNAGGNRFLLSRD